MRTIKNQESSGLRQVLTSRHVTMIAIAGVIGAGLFVGSGPVIASSGPGAILAYAVAGFLVIMVMRMLGDLALLDPVSGSFSVYADRALGSWAGFSVGWLYTWFWVILLGIEATAGAAIISRWVPQVDQWLWAFILLFFLTVTSLVSVKFFGEFEFWFALIKVLAIVVFIILGVAAVLGFLPNFSSPGFDNILGNGGFFPNGFSVIYGAIVIVVFSFFGTEIATVAASESKDPRSSVSKALRSTVLRIVFFYLGSIGVIIFLLPWDSVAVGVSPYVTIMDLYGISYAAVVMDLIIFVAVLSCLNSGIYTSSRMLFSLAGRGEAPFFLARLSGGGIPRRAIFCATGVGALTVILNYVDAEGAFLILVNTSGSIALLVWLTIVVSHLVVFSKRGGGVVSGDMRVVFFPYLNWVAIISIVVLLVTMAILESTRREFVFSLGLAVCVVVLGVVKHNRNWFFR